VRTDFTYKERIMISEKMLDSLREDISGKISAKRFFHTAEVEKMAAYLGELYAPELIPELRAAALLHDITKEYPTALQISICRDEGIALEADAVFAPKTLHARTAAALIPKLYPEFATDTVIGCVRWHTTGRDGMTMAEKIIYLADYIDMSRTFSDCVKLREYFNSKDLSKMSDEQKAEHLSRTLVLSYDMTVRGLLDEGRPISRDSIEARNALIRELITKKT